MRILFVHQNFPGQFKHLAPAFAANNEVVSFSMAEQQTQAGIRPIVYAVGRGSSVNIHPWVAETEAKVIRGEAAYRAALAEKKRGFSPDIIIAHPGWGESLFLKDVWPNAKIGLYCEYHYHYLGFDVGFDSEFPGKDESEACRIRMKNANNFLHFDVMDAGMSPTYWQASTFPEFIRNQIDVIHDGIDTDLIVPDVDVTVTLNGSLTLTRQDEIITFVNRNLEPGRGYHIFMRALPEILRRRPKARVLIVGGDGVSYGAKAPDGTTWKNIFLQEVGERLDPDRVHFVGNIPYEHFISLLQLSRLHVYLTYPFVLSWSLLEAMSAGCAIVASDTGPVREVIKHDETGRLVGFFNVEGLVNEICALLEDHVARAQLGENARAFAVSNYDLKSVCLPRQLKWVERLAEMRS